VLAAALSVLYVRSSLLSLPPLPRCGFQVLAAALGVLCVRSNLLSLPPLPRCGCQVLAAATEVPENRCQWVTSGRGFPSRSTPTPTPKPTPTPTPTPTTTPTPTPTKVVWIRFDTGTSKSVKKLSCSLPSEGLSKAACLPEQ